jgi:hypothetical protein
MEKVNFFEKIYYKIFPPKALVVDALITHGWKFPRPIKKDFPQFVICPMESGKKALLRLKEVQHYGNVDDMYSVQWQFIYYINT